MRWWSVSRGPRVGLGGPGWLGEASGRDVGRALADVAWDREQSKTERKWMSGVVVWRLWGGRALEARWMRGLMNKLFQLQGFDAL